ncbi:MAG: hypothetical protein ACOC2M_00540 [bacterium]
MNNRKCVLFDLRIQETNPRFKNNTSVLKVKIPIDSKNRGVPRQTNRACRDLLYFLFEMGYTSPNRIMLDSYWYDSNHKWNKQPINKYEK